MIKGGKIWAQPPICKVPKPQYVFYSLPPMCTWHLYENIKQEESSNLYWNSWQGRPAFSISTHIEARVWRVRSIPRIFENSNIESQNMKFNKKGNSFHDKSRLWSKAGWRRNLFLFHLGRDYPPLPKYVLTLNCENINHVLHISETPNKTRLFFFNMNILFEKNIASM